MDFTFIILSIAFLLTGILTGFIAGLLGVGGGIVIVPVTYFVLLYLGYPSSLVMHIAIASSLGVIVFTSMSSVFSHYKLKNIDYFVIKKWTPGIIIGSVMGSYLASKIEEYYNNPKEYLLKTKLAKKNIKRFTLRKNIQNYNNLFNKL